MSESSKARSLPIAAEQNDRSLQPSARHPSAQQGPSRRDVIRHGALALTAAGAASAAGSRSLFPEPVPGELASEVHAHLQQTQQANPASDYQPQAFLPHEWKTLRLLAEMIIPADDVSGSAVDAGAPEFIDLLASNSDRLKLIFTAGFLWLDHTMKERTETTFLDASEEQRHLILGDLARGIEERDPGYPSFDVESIEYQRFQHYTTEPGNPVAHGLRFFGWLRRMVMDGFYTSPMGIADVGFEGNKFLRTYEVPSEPMEYVKRRQTD